MQYVLVQNKQTVLLGPIFWRHRFIQSELDDLEVEFQVPPVEPNEYLKINDSLEIYPVTGLDIPPHDTVYEQLAGPYWVFTDGVANGTYNIAPKELSAIKNYLKALTASERYKKETKGIKLTIQNTEVSVGTDRDSRNIYTQKVVSMSDTDTAQWKFPETWLTLTKTELNSLLASVNNYVQLQYDWEESIVIQIDAAQNVEELKQIVIITE